MFDPGKPFFIKNYDGDEWEHSLCRVVCTDKKNGIDRAHAIILVSNGRGYESVVEIDVETGHGRWLSSTNEGCCVVEED